MKIKRLAQISSEIPVASMSDIAFLLIVFFMIVAVFSLETGLSLRLPDKDKPPLKVSDQKIIELRISRDNSLKLNGDSVSLEELGDYLSQPVSRNRQFVAIQAHAKSQYKTAVLVIEQFKRNGFDKISLKKQRP
ncbi:biopolymer transporter ExbD [bacterium]|nr:biopolymer transporter ExbD [bacterium]